MKPSDYDVFEIFDELESIKDRDNKIEWLACNFKSHKPLEYVIRFNYDKNIISKLPDGEPPFNKEEIDGPSRSNLWQYLNIFPVLVQSTQSQKMKISRIEQIFIEMLDAISTKEAEMICMAKDRMLESKWSIDLELFEKAFNYGIIPATMPAITPKTPEEIATELLSQASDLKEKAKEFNVRAKELEAEAKKIAASV